MSCLTWIPLQKFLTPQMKIVWMMSVYIFLIRFGLRLIKLFAHLVDHNCQFVQFQKIHIFFQTLMKIRKNVRFNLKSSIALLHMKKAFLASKDFKTPLRPLLYFKTRWGSTLAMAKRYRQIEPVINDAHQSMIREQGSSA